MKITGYRTLTEKERDYLTIRCLLQKYGMLKDEIPTLTIPHLLDELRGGVPFGIMVNPDALVKFCVTCVDSPDYHLRLAELPKDTLELFIEAK